MNIRKSKSALSWEKDAKRFFDRHDKQNSSDLEKYELKTLLGQQKNDRVKVYERLSKQNSLDTESKANDIKSSAPDISLEEFLDCFKEMETEIETKEGDEDLEKLRSKTRKKRSLREKSTRRASQAKRRVRFAKNVTVKYMPSKDLVDARRSRKGPWEPAPDDDELWDGDTQTFREKVLTQTELQELIIKKEQLQNEQFYYNYEWGQSDTEQGDMDYAYFDDIKYDNGFYEPNTSKLRTFSNMSSKAHYSILPMETWSTDNVCDWLRTSVSCGEYYTEQFEKDKLNGKKFVQVDEKYLRSIGIRRHNDRVEILQARSEHLSAYYS